MKIETFFEKFDLVASLPTAIPAMRELVFQLAVRGHLTEQIDGEKTEAQLDLAEAFRISRGKRAEPDATTNPFPIPNKWGWVAVGDCMEMINGKAFKPEEWSTEGTPIIRIQNLNNINAPFNCCKAEQDSKIHVHDGEFLISWSGTPGTSFGAFIWNRGFAYLNQHIFRCKLVEDIFVKDFLRLAINARLDEMISQAHGAVGLRHITKGKLECIRLPLPPLAEQKRIVAKVDELMALCDRLEEQQQERETRHAALARASLARFADAPTPANLDYLFHSSYTISSTDLRKTILTLAVHGKLVPQDPGDEPGERILQRIHSGASFKKSLNGSMPSEDFGELPFGLPNGWSASRLGSILLPARAISYGVIKLGAEPQQGGVFILRCSNVRFRRIDLNGIRKVTEQLSSEYSRTILEGGEVLINVRGTLGGCAVVSPELKGYNIAREVAVIPVHTEIDPTFLLNVIASPYFQDRVDENLRGIAYEGLNLGLLRDFFVPIPPLAEQRRIVAKVEQLMALVDALETQLAASRAIAANLLTALVAELTGTPESRVASLAPAKQVAALPRPKSHKANVATAKPATHESTVSPRTLVDLRKSAGLSQAAVAKAMGLNQVYISQMETGKRLITEEQMQQFNKILGSISCYELNITK